MLIVHTLRVDVTGALPPSCSSHVFTKPTTGVSCRKGSGRRAHCQPYEGIMPEAASATVGASGALAPNWCAPVSWPCCPAWQKEHCSRGNLNKACWMDQGPLGCRWPTRLGCRRWKIQSMPLVMYC